MSENNVVRNFENKRWKSRPQSVVFRHVAGLQILPEHVSSLADMGCGEGTFMAMVHEKKPKVKLTGVDLSEVAVQLAEKKIPSASFTIADISGKLPFDDNIFDVVSALDVLEHTLEPEEMLSEMVRISRRYVLICVPNFSSFPARLQMLFGKVPENNRPNKGHMYWFNRKSLYALLQDSDLRVVKEVSSHQLQRKAFLGPIIGRLNSIFPALFTLSFVVLAEKQTVR